MIRQRKQFHVSRLGLVGGMDPIVAACREAPGLRRDDLPGLAPVRQFPRRPDAGVISETIPLFYIAQDRNGFWLAREADGGDGGLFLLKRSALRFAHDKSRLRGCATMLLAERFELDVSNQGSRFVAGLAAATDFVARRAPALACFVRMAAAEWRKLVAEISRALASERKHRAAIETELFRNQYRLSSKNDDDLPIP
jgi:hypothetical protein